MIQSFLARRRNFVFMSAFVMIIFSGLAIRCHHLDFQSFWSDEIVTWMECWAPDFSKFTTIYADNEVTPPLYFILQFAIARFVPASEEAVRALSVLSGLGLIVAAGLFSAALTAERKQRLWAGLAGSAFIAFSYRAISMSREARCYSFLSFVSALSCWTWLRVDFAATERKNVRAGGYLACALMVCYTHYYGVLLVLAQALGALLLNWRSPKAWRNGVVIYGALLIGYVPWLMFLMRHPPNTFQIWALPPLSEFFVVHRELFGSSAINSLLALVLAGVAIGFAGRPRELRWRLVVVVSWVPLVFLEAWAVSRVRSVWAERYYIAVALAPMLAVSASGVAAIVSQERSRWRSALAAFVLVLFCVLSLHETIFGRQLFTHPPNEQIREGVHEALQVLKAMPSAQLAVVSFPPFVTDYYMELEKAPRLFPRNEIKKHEEFLQPARWPAEFRTNPDVVALFFTYADEDFDRYLTQPIAGYDMISRKDFYHVSVVRLKKSL